MNSETWELGRSAGDSDQAGRGTAGELPRLSPLLRFTAFGYAVMTPSTVALAIMLAPWGLFLILLALVFAAVAVVTFTVAAGIEQIEADA